MAAARGAVVVFTDFLDACKTVFDRLVSASTAPGGADPDAAQEAAALVLLGGGAPNCRPGQMWLLTVCQPAAARRAPCLLPGCTVQGCPGNTLETVGRGAHLVFVHHKNSASWALEPAVINVEVGPAPPPGPPGRARNVRSFRRAQAGTTAARVLEIAARVQLARAAGAGWSPLFTRVDGTHRGKSSFRSGLTSLLRDGLNLGAGVTAKSLRWAAVDHFMGQGYTADQRKGAGPPPRTETGAPRPCALRGRWGRDRRARA